MPIPTKKRKKTPEEFVESEVIEDNPSISCETVQESQIKDDKKSPDIVIPSQEENTDAQVEQTEQAQEPRFVTDVENGLSQAEVDERIAQGKINGDQNVKTKSVAQILRENIVTFFNFVFILLAVLIFFFVDAGESPLTVLGNFSFMLLIIFNALVGIFQELRAKRTIDKLSLLSAPKATVLRDGEEKEIAIKDIVLDDITLLASGSQICADAIVAEGAIEVNESLITGEPYSKPRVTRLCREVSWYRAKQKRKSNTSAWTISCPKSVRAQSISRSPTAKFGVLLCSS